MKNHIRYIVILLFCIFSIKTYSSDSVSRGLHFRSFDVDQDKRTGLNLTPENKITTANGFILKFDIKLKQLSNNFGYVFRIIGNDSVNIDLISDLTSTDYLFSLVTGAKSLIKIKREELKNFKVDEWINVELKYDKQSNSISLNVDNLQKKAPFISEKLKNIDINFGLNNNPIFSTTDVPPMTIRDIKILDERNELKRYWKLERHGLDKVYDEQFNKKATCINPVWEIDRHVKWLPKAHLSIPFILPQIAYNEDNGQIYFVKNNLIFTYNALKQSIDSAKAKKGASYNCSANQLIFDKNSKKLISYNFDNSNLAEFDFQKLEWTNENTQIFTVMPRTAV